MNKIEKIQERCLKLIHNDYDKEYSELLELAKKPTMKTKRLRILIIEIFKTLNKLNPEFMNDIFHHCLNIRHKKYNLHVHSRNTTKFGNNSLRALGAHTWNSLPENIKSTDSIYKLKEFLKDWNGCQCHLCV